MVWFTICNFVGKTDNNYFVYYNSPNESTSAKAELSRIYPSVSGIFTVLQLLRMKQAVVSGCFKL